MTLNIIDCVKGDKELALLLRRAVADSGLTQAKVAAVVGKHQTWLPNYLFFPDCWSYPLPVHYA